MTRPPLSASWKGLLPSRRAPFRAAVVRVAAPCPRSAVIRPFWPSSSLPGENRTSSSDALSVWREIPWARHVLGVDGSPRHMAGQEVGKEWKTTEGDRGPGGQVEGGGQLPAHHVLRGDPQARFGPCQDPHQKDRRGDERPAHGPSSRQPLAEDAVPRPCAHSAELDDREGPFGYAQRREPAEWPKCYTPTTGQAVCGSRRATGRRRPPRHLSLTPHESGRSEGESHATVSRLRFVPNRRRRKPLAQSPVRALRGAMDPGGRRAESRPSPRPIPAQHICGLPPARSTAGRPFRAKDPMSNGRAGRTSNHELVPMNGPRVPRFPPWRVCVGCATVLSIYNATSFCSVHEPPGRPARRSV
jgi:hypothetical protein